MDLLYVCYALLRIFIFIIMNDDDDDEGHLIPVCPTVQ